MDGIVFPEYLQLPVIVADRQTDPPDLPGKKSGCWWNAPIRMCPDTGGQDHLPACDRRDHKMQPDRKITSSSQGWNENIDISVGAPQAFCFAVTY